MVQFTLPKNSKIKKGKEWNRPAKDAEGGRFREYRIYRYDPAKLRYVKPAASASGIAPARG